MPSEALRSLRHLLRARVRDGAPRSWPSLVRDRLLEWNREDWDASDSHDSAAAIVALYDLGLHRQVLERTVEIDLPGLGTVTRIEIACPSRTGVSAIHPVLAVWLGDGTLVLREQMTEEDLVAVSAAINQ